MNKRYLLLPAALLAASGVLTQAAQAHFAWLATDSDGHAVMWFGESTDDRTYPMPETIQTIELHNDSAQSAIETKPVDENDLVGIQSVEAIDADSELIGTATYGLYHGTKLTYHVEHLPQADPAAWPEQARTGAALQTIIRPSDEGGVNVTVLQGGKPLADTDVKLYGEAGHEEADRKTDEKGSVHFSADEVESGLNAVIVGYSDDQAEGTLNGESFTSTTDYLTATFRMPAASDEEPEEKEESKPEPQVDPNSSATTGPANLPELPENLTSFGAAIADGKLYVYGGHTGGAHSYSKEEQSDRFWSLDLSQGKDGQWKELPGGPTLQGLALVAHNGNLIRIGGFSAVNEEGEDHNLQSQNTVTSFDPKKQAWTKLSDLPAPRSSLDAAVLGDKVYVIGGWNLQGDSDQSEWHDTAWSLDLSDSSAKWQPLAEPPFERRALSVAAHDGKLYVIGGMTSDNEITTDVAIYDPATDSWSDGPELPVTGMSGFGSSAFATGGKLYVTTMGGFVSELSEDGKTWRTIAKTERERFFHRMLPSSDHELLMIGGASMEVGKFGTIDRIEVK
ncbi:Kelch repeat-containing protein [Allorhodopirellula solitaria]|uniref:N-acetylneuraminate epimerase n=1 Tax=Allorhodopirellula solitaria TaxID=2527987 RepID=A0A5C5YHM2_9BACT|nr:kelch repeat-containing protein [Allorhodopirellula solitaria]TWT74315.1 N-acetylneuraminate epimerase precursor [Allorhodopirellula solitaria]